MFPDIKTAQEELRLAGQLNPGPWVEHSLNVGRAAACIARNVPGMDPVKANVCGLLHDIGRRVGVVSIAKHVYEGFRYTMSKGWDEAAKVCMTHSYPLMAKELQAEGGSEEEFFIKSYIERCQCDDYDYLIQLCDSLAADYGFCILEKRFVDVARRYGLEENTLARWERTFAIKERFETRAGCSIYDLLPDIGRTTLLCPPPWKPNAGEKTGKREGCERAVAEDA